MVVKQFEIQFLKPIKDKVELELLGANSGAYGQIKLADYTETFRSPFDVWSSGDYTRQWNEAIHRIREGAESTCFIVSVFPPLTCPNFESWIIWRQGTEFHVQNTYLVFFENLRHVDPFNPYGIIGSYHTVSEDGERISDWKLPLNAFD